MHAAVVLPQESDSSAGTSVTRLDIAEIIYRRLFELVGDSEEALSKILAASDEVMSLISG